MKNKIILAYSERGRYELIDGWVYNNAESTGYGSCWYGDIDYFADHLEDYLKDIKLTKEGERLVEIYKNCKRVVRCTRCDNKTCKLYTEKIDYFKRGDKND